MGEEPTILTQSAFGRPGIAPRWTSSSKEGVGTAYSTSSRVWFTISHGILNEVYYPTIDRPQIRDLQFLVSDGETFFHTEAHDLESEIECIEPHAIGYRIVSRDPQGRYQIIKEITTDPHQPCVLLHARVKGNPQWLDRLRVYVLLAPHVGVGGAGNSARRVRCVGHDVLVAWKGETHLALGSSIGFTATSCGFVGASDGWQDLNENMQMDWDFACAEDGNVAVIGQVDLSRGREFTIGLAFGDGLHDALTTLQQSLAIPFPSQRKRFVAQWNRACQNMPPLHRLAYDNGRLYRISQSLLLAHEDKTFAGAIIASASIPWGNAKGDEDIGGYHLVWTRDMVNSAMGLMAAGNTVTPYRALVYLACSQRPDGGFPQNFWIDGTPYWSGVQLDEVAFPVILAWRLWHANALEQFDPYPMVKAAAGYLIRQGPMTQQERWEENGGYSPSTLAATIAALICAADFAADRGEVQTATFIEEYADFLESHIERWTVTTDGALLTGVPRHYIRIHPVALGDCSPDENPNHGAIAIANRPPSEPWQFPAKDVVDAGFLELVRYGIRKPGTALMDDSLRVIDAVLKVETPFGPCWRRYNHDGYGPGPNGRPYLTWGKGRAWPLLTGERGHYELAHGRDVKPYVEAMERFAGKGGMLPEQVWDEADCPEAGMYLGRPAGSAMPLMWAHAEYTKLLRSAADGRAFDFIPVVADRYLAGRGRTDLEVWKPNRRVGRVSPGQTLRILRPTPFRLRWTLDQWHTCEDATAEANGLGIYSIDIPVPGGQKVPVLFTFYLTERQAWEGRDFRVDVTDTA